MVAPLFKVEVAFADGPNAAAPTYTDISQYVRRDPALTYSRGNTDEVGQLQPGRMTFVVDNSNGKFTVGNTTSTSTWGTVLKIRRPVRLSIWNGTSYVVAWTGLVDDWGTGWVGGVQGRTLVSCSDRLALAGRVDLGDSATAELLSDSPTILVPLDDGVGTTSPAEIVAGGIGTLTLNAFTPGSYSATFGATTFPGPDGGTGLTFATGADDAGWWLSAGSASGGSALTIECFAEVTRTPTATPTTLVALQGGVSLSVNSSGQPTAYVGLSAVCTGTTRVDDSTVHHFALTASISGGTLTAIIYVDGVQAATGTVASGSLSASSLAVGGDPLYGFMSGTIWKAAYHTSALSSARILEHARALTGWVGEATGARWNRACRIAGLSSTWYTSDTGYGAMGAQSFSGKTLASALQEVVDVEQGSGYCTTAGVLTMKSRDIRMSKSSTLTIAPQTVDRDLLFIANDAYLVNEAAVTREGGSTGTASSASSKTDNGTYRRTMTIACAYDWQALNLAQWLVYRYADPQNRARTITINGTAKASSITAVNLLALDVNSRVTLSPLPATAPSSSIDLFVDGLQGEIGREWVVTFNTSPTNNLTGWVLGTSALDSTSLLLY